MATLLRKDLKVGQVFRYVKDSRGERAAGAGVGLVCKDPPTRLPRGWFYSMGEGDFADSEVVLLNEDGKEIIQRKDLVPGDCFRYAENSLAAGIHRGNKFVVTDKITIGGTLPGLQLPRGWFFSGRGCMYMESEVIRIPSWHEEEEWSLMMAIKDLHYNLDFACKKDPESARKLSGINSQQDLEKASSYWSAELRRRVEETKEKERNTVTVDWGDYWD